ncbi:ABC transporter ATP-binding protein [Patiriisocius marinus]|uniref:ABC transporter ATP-binding protein n=1 Tax=Patiriisocius marinus TaxID=1397112 RepID=A0A5J4IPQ0_9FLAO|nr:ABC transporter ATP-binding protein [Patiriisocius marinus]GER59705.1 ABC transporter ATP-binding protein [Patiriisocius marinus]
MGVILKAENVSKQYRLGLVGTGTLSHDLNRFWARIRGKEDPYLKVGAVNDRATKAESEYVWALKDINFEVQQGEILGIIGKNGAGKSTLLKLLSRVTGPTTGTIKTKGTIASLLEVGTGFHPELTGRENVYLNGAILGMRKAEIATKLDEIIEFSGCEKYIDTPVKRYSSGMRVRLAFAVAAHLEPDILVIDEVLAVGDAEFQKKAIGKMQDISQGEGRTVLFVSHNMAAVKSLCTRAILIENGEITYSGNVEKVLQKYYGFEKNQFLVESFSSDKDIYFNSVTINDNSNVSKSIYNYEEDINLNISIEINKIQENSALFVLIMNDDGIRVFSAETPLNEFKNNYILKINGGFLSKGNYKVDLYLHIPLIKRFDSLIDVLFFKVFDTSSEFTKHKDFNHGLVFGNYTWIK